MDFIHTEGTSYWQLLLYCIAKMIIFLHPNRQQKNKKCEVFKTRQKAFNFYETHSSWPSADWSGNSTYQTIEQVFMRLLKYCEVKATGRGINNYSQFTGKNTSSHSTSISYTRIFKSFTSVHSSSMEVKAFKQTLLAWFSVSLFCWLVFIGFCYLLNLYKVFKMLSKKHC